MPRMVANGSAFNEVFETKFKITKFKNYKL